MVMSDEEEKEECRSAVVCIFFLPILSTVLMSALRRGERLLDRDRDRDLVRDRDLDLDLDLGSSFAKGFSFALVL